MKIPPMTHNLILHLPDEEPVLYELNADRIGVGRAIDNQIQIDLEMISSAHCELHRREGGYEIRDLKSKNGIRLNGQKVERMAVLSDGDRLLIAETVPAFFVSLAAGESPDEAVVKGDSALQQSAASYASLGEKINELEEKLDAIRIQIEAKQSEFKKLTRSIEKQEVDIASMAAQGANEAEIGAMKEDLLVKTQRVTVLKSDMVEAEKELATLEKTAKTAVRAPQLPASRPPIAPPVPGAGPKKPPMITPSGPGPKKPPMPGAPPKKP